MFDLLNLNYIRTILVSQKSGFRNLREKEEENENNFVANFSEKRKKKKIKEKNGENEISSEEEENIEIILTKDRILELQTRDSNGIKSFINSLPFYGNDISLFKHRPNKEKYPVGKAQEPLIKIDVSNYTKRIDVKLKENPEFLKRIKNRQKEGKILNNIEDNNSVKTNLISSTVKQNENNQERQEEINRNLIVDNSFSLINIFNVKSITIIKYLDFFIYAFTIIIIFIEFLMSYLSYLDNIKRFSFLNSSYNLLNDITYTKYFVSEAIFINSIENYLFDRVFGKEEYFKYIKGELSKYRQELTDIMNLFSNANIEFSKEYREYTSNTNVTIKTLSNDIQKNEEQPFFSAFNKLTTSLFYVSTITDNSQINMKNPYSYELMVNLLNGYYISFEKIIIIILNDFNEKIKNSGLKNLIIFFITFFISCFYLVLFWKMMTNLNNDREKPINLFLTIKKKIFEDLKNSAENFSNKLLNKFFGVDENEEESRQDYRANIKPNDINIAKFKALNDFKSSSNSKKNSFIYYFVQLTIFYVIFILIILSRYINTRIYYSNMDKFTEVYNSTQFSQIYLITRIDIVKQYFYNKSIVNYNMTEDSMIYNFLQCFMNTTNQLEDTIKLTSKTTSFLKNGYKNIFSQYMYNNFSEILSKETDDPQYYNYMSRAENGFKFTSFEIFEIIKYLVIKYLAEEEENQNVGNNISKLINDGLWEEIGILIFYFIRPWYTKVNLELDNSFYSEVNSRIIEYIVSFIVTIILTSIYYWIFWKRYENEFIKSIKKSFDLINLIPEEIKNIIVNKLNE